ncbi:MULTISPECIES: hypothetical protein [unclassified Citrobacter]|uniref:hypothetical protein n=1 Tax=unclassified Citrobacter TaxID=2644389 RepID=UPI0015EAB89B|nr:MULTISPECIES: hypothetical protein [unclassified Citrobacter]HAH0500287.1 hypothetical protein [Escherichia coli]MBA8057494.1 hypothetical protein [Citrobacter sp. RHBSTW-00104]QLR62001.1 hypothetical protein HV341_08015 [Citrobacter sp. RHBSTW-00976]QLW54481.1 hypothetical protein HV250_07890 [Citrobacter sp. RHBSTW-00628]QLW59369.1 hypothetical protein HV258_07820 [Citrobacter sp. RHBSTW-00667]
MTALNKQALTDEAISQAFTGTNFGRDDLRNILAETVIDAAAGWRCGYTATTICTQLGLLTPKGSASALGLRFISEHVQRETKRLKDGLEAAEKRIAELEARELSVHWPEPKDYTQGWKIEPEFISKVQDAIGYDEECQCWEGTPSMEMVEAVLIAAAGIGVKGD